MIKSLNSKKELREFGIIVGLLFPLIIGYVIPKILGHAFNTWTLLIGIPLLLLGILVPKILKFPYKIWMGIGKLLARINNNLVLTMVFLLIMQPTAIIMKCLKYDPLKSKKDKMAFSYREKKNNDKVDLNKIF